MESAPTTDPKWDPACPSPREPEMCQLLVVGSKQKRGGVGGGVGPKTVSLGGK